MWSDRAVRCRQQSCCNKDRKQCTAVCIALEACTLRGILFLSAETPLPSLPSKHLHTHTPATSIQSSIWQSPRPRTFNQSSPSSSHTPSGHVSLPFLRGLFPPHAQPPPLTSSAVNWFHCQAAYQRRRRRCCVCFRPRPGRELQTATTARLPMPGHYMRKVIMSA